VPQPKREFKKPPPLPVFPKKEVQKIEEPVKVEKPPRPFDPNRMAEMSKAKPKAADPELKPEPKKKRASKLTLKQLKERANRVK